MRPVTPAEEQARDIVARACEAYRVVPEQIMGRERHLAAAWARQVVYYALIQIGWSSADIARYLGRDHSTVYYGVKHVERRIAVDISERRLVQYVSEVLPASASDERQALQEVEEAAERITQAVTHALEVLTVLEGHARALRAAVKGEIPTRGAA